MQQERRKDLALLAYTHERDRLLLERERIEEDIAALDEMIQDIEEGISRQLGGRAISSLRTEIDATDAAIKDVPSEVLPLNESTPKTTTTGPVFELPPFGSIPLAASNSDALEARKVWILEYMRRKGGYTQISELANVLAPQGITKRQVYTAVDKLRDENAIHLHKMSDSLKNFYYMDGLNPKDSPFWERAST